MKIFTLDFVQFTRYPCVNVRSNQQSHSNDCTVYYTIYYTILYSILYYETMKVQTRHCSLLYKTKGRQHTSRFVPFEIKRMNVERAVERVSDWPSYLCKSNTVQLKKLTDNCVMSGTVIAGSLSYSDAL